MPRRSDLSRSSPDLCRRESLSAEFSWRRSWGGYRRRLKPSASDVYEDRRADLGAVCVYDCKAGAEGLTAKRVGKIAQVVHDLYGDVIFYIFEIRPAP